MKIQIENLKALMTGRELNVHQKADALIEFNKLLDYVDELEQLTTPAVLLDVNERYYFKTRGQEPDVECTQRCMFRDNGICIGSAACQKCEHHFENNIDEWGCISWIKCRKINEAVSKNDSQRIEGFA